MKHSVSDKILKTSSEVLIQAGRARLSAYRGSHSLPAGDVKKLKGQPYYRLRIGDIRVLFGRDGSVILIVKIDNRGQVYKK